MEKVVIGINGPNKSGKGWLIREMLSRIHNDPWVAPAIQAGTIKLTVFEVSMLIYESAIKSGYITDHNGMSAQEYKDSKPHGRQRIIEFGEMAREQDPNIFSKAIVESGRYKNSNVIFVDNFGVPTEPPFFGGKNVSDFCATLAIRNPYDPSRIYSEDPAFSTIGEMWPNDCRYPLPATNGWEASDSQEMFEKFDAVMNYAAASTYGDVGVSSRDQELIAGIDYQTLVRWRRIFMGRTGS